jgi:hypothetical protein
MPTSVVAKRIDTRISVCSLRKTGEIAFIGGKDYLPLFCELTDNVKAKRIAFFNTVNTPRFDNCVTGCTAPPKWTDDLTLKRMKI